MKRLRKFLVRLRYDLRPELRDKHQRAAAWVAWHLPWWVVYWSLLRAGWEECGGPNRPDETVIDVPFTVVLERWAHRKLT